MEICRFFDSEKRIYIFNISRLNEDKHSWYLSESIGTI